MKQRWKWGAPLLGWVLLGCATLPRPAQAEPLYFALEVRRGGELVGRPLLLGETGKTVRAERRQPGALTPDYQLVLHPSQNRAEYQIALELTVDETIAQSQLAIGHGQERRFQLGARPGDLEVSLLLMRVDSPEFRALMKLPSPSPADSTGAAAI